jgi:hypothetical protein
MSNLATLRAAVRKDLHDEDAAAFRWVDAVLDRHIKRALREYSQVSPLEVKTGLFTVAGSRDVSIASLTARVRVVAAEWPTLRYPPQYAPFALWGEILTLDVLSPPSGVESVNVLWHQEHVINGSGSFSVAHDDIISGGAAGYAALEWGSFASNRVNVGGNEVWGRYMDFAKVRLEEFQAALRRLPAANALRTGELYSGDDRRLRSQSTDPGPV